MTKDQIIQIAMDCNSMMVLEMREMDAKDEFLLEFAAAIRAATKEEDARICEDRTLNGQLVHSSAVLNCAAAIRASK